MCLSRFPSSPLPSLYPRLYSVRTRAVSIPRSPPSALSLSFSFFRPRSLPLSLPRLCPPLLSLSSPSVLFFLLSLPLFRSSAPPTLLRTGRGEREGALSSLTFFFLFTVLAFFLESELSLSPPSLPPSLSLSIVFVGVISLSDGRYTLSLPPSLSLCLVFAFSFSTCLSYVLYILLAFFSGHHGVQRAHHVGWCMGIQHSRGFS